MKVNPLISPASDIRDITAADLPFQAIIKAVRPLDGINGSFTVLTQHAGEIRTIAVNPQTIGRYDPISCRAVISFSMVTKLRVYLAPELE